MRAGIDMVHLSIKPDRYTLKDAGKFHQKHSVIQYGEAPKVWGVTKNGQDLTGSLFVNRGKGGYDATVEVKEHGLFIQFNPSKMVHPYELTTDVEKQVGTVKKLVHDLSIDVDLDSAAISRLDLTKQAVMKTPIYGFSAAFSAINGKRSKHRVQYPDGFEVGNKSRSVVFYDKTKEQIGQGNGNVPTNLLRAECRWVGSNVVGKANNVGVGTLRDLIFVDSDQLTDSYNRYMRNDIFKASDGLQLSLNLDIEIDVLSTLLSQYGVSGAVNQYLAYSGVEHLITVFGSTQKFKEVLLSLGVKRSTAYKRMSAVDKILSEASFINRRRHSKDGVSSQMDILLQTFVA